MSFKTVYGSIQIKSACSQAQTVMLRLHVGRNDYCQKSAGNMFLVVTKHKALALTHNQTVCLLGAYGPPSSDATLDLPSTVRKPLKGILLFLTRPAFEQ